MSMQILNILVLLIAIAIIIRTGLAFYSMRKCLGELDSRQALVGAVKNLRLNKMLDHLNMPLERYVDTVPANEIMSHILNCRKCKNINTCDKYLRRGATNTEVSFCPNFKSLSNNRKYLSRG